MHLFRCLKSSEKSQPTSPSKPTTPIHLKSTTIRNSTSTSFSPSISHLRRVTSITDVPLTHQQHHMNMEMEMDHEMNRGGQDKLNIQQDEKGITTEISNPMDMSTEEMKMSNPEDQTDMEEEGIKYVKFLKWMKTGGAKFPHLVLRRYTENYRGVHIRSNEQIPKGKVLLRIPHALLITVEVARASEIGKLVSTLTNLGSQAILAVYLLQERLKGPSSFWSPWIDVLPTSFSTLPMFFNNYELSLLSSSPDLLNKIKSQQKSMREEYMAIMKLKGIQDFLAFTYDEFVWACLAVGTRVFSLCINGHKTSVLAPLADMMNHKNPAGTNWTFDSKKNAFTLTTCMSMGDGEAIHESYGVKDNKRFFASYGFVLEDNAANEVTICIRGDLVIDTNTVRHFTVRGCYDALAEELLSYLRIANAYEYQLDGNEHPDLNHSYRPFTGPLSVDNELSALYALRCACKDHLRNYDTTLEEDLALLESPDMQLPSNMNIRNCLIFRIGEKKIYQFFIDWATGAISLLCVPWEEAKIKIRQIMDPDQLDQSMMSGTMAYISGVVAPLLQERHRAMLRKKKYDGDSGRPSVTPSSRPYSSSSTSSHKPSSALGFNQSSLLHSINSMLQAPDDEDDDEDMDTSYDDTYLKKKSSTTTSLPAVTPKSKQQQPQPMIQHAQAMRQAAISLPQVNTGRHSSKKICIPITTTTTTTTTTPDKSKPSRTSISRKKSPTHMKQKLSQDITPPIIHEDTNETPQPLFPRIPSASLSRSVSYVPSQGHSEYGDDLSSESDNDNDLLGDEDNDNEYNMSPSNDMDMDANGELEQDEASKIKGEEEIPSRTTSRGVTPSTALSTQLPQSTIPPPPRSPAKTSSATSTTPTTTPPQRKTSAHSKRLIKRTSQPATPVKRVVHKTRIPSTSMATSTTTPTNASTPKPKLVATKS